MNLPFTNIRQVLSLHNKVSPEKIFLTVISENGREELSYAEFSARCHQTANFLQEDLGIEPGDVVAIDDTEPARLAVLFTACWLVGAIVKRHLAGNEKAYFLPDVDGDKSSLIDELIAWNGNQTQRVQLGGNPSTYPHFDTLVRGMPNSFFNEFPEPNLDTSAYYSKVQDDPSTEIFSQGLLLERAETLANKQIITGNQRLISYMVLGEFAKDHEVILRTLSFFLTPMLVGGSVIIDTRFYPHAQQELFWREVAASRLHVACISIEHIPKLTKYAREQQAAGKPIYGEGIYQQDITQLRHIYCPDAFGPEGKHTIKQFTAMFPFPVVTNP